MSCLFHSIGTILCIPTETVRDAICDYLLSDRPLLDGMPTRDLLALEDPNYVQNMRKSSTWGGAIEIQAAVRLWNVNVTVLNHRDGSKPIEFLATGAAIGTLTLSWTGGHYEPVAWK
jgi:OTU-like cysteine protease